MDCQPVLVMLSSQVKAMLPCGCLAYVEGEHSSTAACIGACLPRLHKSPHRQNSHPKDGRTLEWRPETVTKCTQVPPAFFLTLCLCHISKPVAKNLTVTSYLTIRHQAFNWYLQSLDQGHHFWLSSTQKMPCHLTSPRKNSRGRLSLAHPF